MKRIETSLSEDEYKAWQNFCLDAGKTSSSLFREFVKKSIVHTNIDADKHSAKILKSKKIIRTAWLNLAAEFKETDKPLSDNIRAFVDTMPSVLTKRGIINQSIFNSVRDISKAKQLLQDHPELKEDIDKILSAQHYANNKYPDIQQKETFMQKLIADIAHKRINGESVQSNIRAKENDAVHKSKDKDKNLDYEI